MVSMAHTWCIMSEEFEPVRQRERKRERPRIFELDGILQSTEFNLHRLEMGTERKRR